MLTQLEPDHFAPPRRETWPSTLLPAMEALKVAGELGGRTPPTASTRPPAAPSSSTGATCRSGPSWPTSPPPPASTGPGSSTPSTAAATAASVIADWQEGRRRGVQGSPHALLPDGTGVFNPGIGDIDWVRGIPIPHGVDEGAIAKLLDQATAPRHPPRPRPDPARHWLSGWPGQYFSDRYSIVRMSVAALRAVSEPRRQQILRLVWDRERPAGEIAASFDVTFGAVSQHLRVLHDAGLVTVRRDGRRRLYQARREHLGPLRDVLEDLWRSGLEEPQDPGRGRGGGHRWLTPGRAGRGAAWWSRPVPRRSSGTSPTRPASPAGWARRRCSTPSPAAGCGSATPTGRSPGGRSAATPRRPLPLPAPPPPSPAPLTLGGTEVRLRHTGLPAGEPPAAHLAGWRHALATLAYAGSADQLGPVLGERVADWLAAWNEPDPVRRAALLGRCLADGGRFRDPTTAVDGVRELADHIGMAQRLIGGTRLAGRGDSEPCHGLVRFGWAAVGPDGTVLATGTNVAGADLDGRFRWVTGFWDPPPDRPEPAERS